jgi:hypothetical protein
MFESAEYLFLQMPDLAGPSNEIVTHTKFVQWAAGQVIAGWQCFRLVKRHSILDRAYLILDRDLVPLDRENSILDII